MFCHLGLFFRLVLQYKVGEPVFALTDGYWYETPAGGFMTCKHLQTTGMRWSLCTGLLPEF
jgi:hypothetical protein